MTDEEPCPECVEKGKCPQCGGELDPEGVVCLAGCGWTYETGEGLPEVPEGPDPEDDGWIIVGAL